MGGQYSRNSSPPPAVVEPTMESDFANLNQAEKKVVLDLIKTILAEVPKAIEHKRNGFGIVFPKLLKIGESKYFYLHQSLSVRNVIGLNSIHEDPLLTSENEALILDISQILKEYIVNPFVFHVGGSSQYLNYNTNDLKNKTYGDPVYWNNNQVPAFIINVSFVQTPA